MWCVYILECANGRYYIGSTNDLLRRFFEHLRSHVKSTRHLRPLKIVFVSECEDELDARQKELFVKKQKSKRFIEELITGEKVLSWSSG